MERSKWEYKKWNEVLTIVNGRDYKEVEDVDGQYPICGSGGEMGRASEYLCPENTVIIGRKGNINKPLFIKEKFWNIDTAFGLVANQLYLLPRFLFYFCLFYDFERHNKAVTIPSLTKGDLLKIKMLVPSIADQQRIVAELDCLNEMIALKQEQLKEFDKLAQSIFYDMFGDPITNEKGWNVVSWNDVLQILNGRNQKLVETPEGKYPICGSAGIMGWASDYICPEDTVIIGRKGNINKPILMREKFWNVDTAFGLVPNREKLDCVYLYYFCDEYDFEKHNRAVTIPSLTKSDLLKISFPLPPLALQQQFAEKIQAIEAQKELVKKSIAETQHLLDSRMDYYFD